MASGVTHVDLTSSLRAQSDLDVASEAETSPLLQPKLDCKNVSNFALITKAPSHHCTSAAGAH